MAKRQVFLGLVVVLLAPQAGAGPGGKRCGWSQWGSDPAHDGEVCVAGQNATRELGHHTVDPFTAQEEAEAGGGLLVHYPVPIFDGKDVFILRKSGAYTSCDPPGSGQPFPCGLNFWASQIWTWQAYRWDEGGVLQPRWTFVSDYKPPQHPTGWEPQSQAAVSGGFVYVPGAGGTMFRVHKATGLAESRINPFGTEVDPTIYVTGGATVDRNGNLYYNALQLDPFTVFNPFIGWFVDAQGWLVKVTPEGEVSKVSYADLVPDAPAPTDLCYMTFGQAVPRPARPWPPAPQPSDVRPPQVPCLSQRAPLNVIPAIGADGTIYTVSRAHRFNVNFYAYVVAVNPDLTPRWHASLRDRLQDGCGRPDGVPYGPGPLDCRVGAHENVDPNTNLPVAGSGDDTSSASPVVVDDGVIYGAFTGYNGFRGHLMKFSAAGAYVGAYDFGWDNTPSIYHHDGTYSIVVKDNHYVTGGPFHITQLDRDLSPEWKYANTSTLTCERLPDGTIDCFDDGFHGGGFEWCVSAATVDRNGTVYVTSEDGYFYAIDQGGVERSRYFMSRTLGAAYTPLAMDPFGRIFAMNDGELFILGD